MAKNSADKNNTYLVTFTDTRTYQSHDDETIEICYKVLTCSMHTTEIVCEGHSSFQWNNYWKNLFWCEKKVKPASGL